MLQSLFASGKLIHRYLSGEYFQDKGSSTHQRSSLDTISPSASFVDLSAAIALCCGAINVKESNDSYNQRSELAAAI